MGFQLGPQEKPMALEKLHKSQCSTECVGLAAGGVAPQSGGGWKRNCHCAPEAHAVGPVEWTALFPDGVCSRV